MTQFNVGRQQHLTEAELEAHLKDIHSNEWAGEGDITISDEAAVTIAGFFAGPSEDLMPFTVLAQQGKGHTGDLGAACLRELDAEQPHDESVGPLMQAKHLLAELDWWVATKE